MIDFQILTIQAQSQYCAGYFDTKHSIKQTNIPTIRGNLVFPSIFKIFDFGLLSNQYHYHSSHLTPHTSHLTPHTSHYTPQTTFHTPNTTHSTPYTQHHIGHIKTPHTSHEALMPAENWPSTELKEDGKRKPSWGLVDSWGPDSIACVWVIYNTIFICNISYWSISAGMYKVFNSLIILDVAFHKAGTLD